MSPEFKSLLKGYISSIEAAGRFGITNDYAALLCRRKKINGIFVGRQWYIEEESLRAYLIHMQEQKNKRYRELSREWRKVLGTPTV